MVEYNTQIRKIAEKLLQEGKVESVIGFKKGSIPMMNEPCIIKSSDDAQILVWDSNCRINLANYLTNRTEKIGIFAKGCDSRNIVNHIIENKIKREQLIIIGVPCTGMIDKVKITNAVDVEITEIIEKDDKITVIGNDFQQVWDKKDILQNNCSLCIHRNPVIYDELVGELVEEQKDIKRYEDIDKIETMPVQEKYDFFTTLLEKCTRCYACRNACPLCYCPTCFVDESKPQWVGKSCDPIDTRTYHLLRAYHCAGRCTDCGACEAACPQNIEVRYFTRKLEKDCFELYGWEAGLTTDKRPPLDTFDANDPDAFIK